MTNYLDSLPGPLVGPGEGPDGERWQWRGLMIDSARTRYGEDTLHLVIELLARYGFNRLHWHLTDDSGWRFPVENYPRLTETGAQLPRNSFAHYGNACGDTVQRAERESEGRWRDGYYTRDEITRIVEHANSRGITVVPEIDIPGHTVAVLTAYPELGRAPSGGQQLKSLLWPHSESIRFIRAALDAALDLFPSEQIHLGGDECEFNQWESDPQLRSLMGEQGWQRGQDIQRWFMEIAVDHVTSRGRKALVWDEVCALDLDREYTAFAWEGAKGLRRVGEDTCPYVFADARTLYLNRVDPEHMDEQKGMTPPISLDDILGAPWPEAYDERCVGLQAALWSEFILDEGDLLSLMLPRLLAVAERLAPRGDDARTRIAEEYRVLRGVLANR